ncbi:MAG: ABC transporter permease subunit, partial [Acidaminococcaceae bacterium]|nr:ABC transporter permease subunit [Acidaminococcaceae bacterium]
MLTLLLYMGCAMSRGWLFRIGLFGLCLALSLWQTDFSAVVLWERGGRFISMTGEMFPPDVTFFGQILETLRDTLCISLAGTGLGAVLGAVGTLLCNSYVNRRKGMRIFLKTVVHVFRCIPVLILALLCTFLFGLGVWAGVVAIRISTGAILARLGYEDSESSDLETTYVLEYTGAGRVKAWLSSVWNQIFPGYLSNVLYILESNVRNAAILGFVGAGGIGLLLNEKLAWREYSKVGAILCALYIVLS